jgi:hypothetical protein
VDRKNARAVLDAYVGVVQTVFDHQQPVRAEVDYFLRKMEDGWIGRDAHQELPKTQFAARVRPAQQHLSTAMVSHVQASHTQDGSGRLSSSTCVLCALCLLSMVCRVTEHQHGAAHSA